MERVARACGVLLVALTLAACGGKQQADQVKLPPVGPAVPAATASGLPIGDSERLRGLLLGVTDLPPSFTALPDPNSDLSLGGLAPTTPAECAKVLSPLASQTSGALAHAAVQYMGPDFAGIDIDAASYSNELVGQAFSQVQAVIARCTRYSGTDGNKPIDYRIGGLTQPSAGDAVTGFQVRSVSDDVALTSSVAIVQVGATLTQIVVSARQPLDPGVLADLTAAQVRKLRGFAGP
ncbi:hypothetical protein [Nocardia arthritidis]|uniref:Sensor domain-containing protein n=1 Tax=Nocardia arthritidis TaxID=228602 RepID=A0A6G9YCS7_9NOCA|nr:hypothetical protein [Nocardia arthritidis]QIS10978.1 hypothetical protein F5544_15475 [Nocardia arthritidis]